MTLRLRLVVALVVLLTTGLVVFGVATYAFYARSEYDRLDDDLRAAVPKATSDLRHELEDLQEHGPEMPDGPPSLEPPHGPYPFVAQLRDASGTILAPSDSGSTDDDDAVPDLPDDLTGGDAPRFLDVGSVEGDTAWRVLVERASKDPTQTVVVALPTTGIRSSLDKLVAIEVVAALALLAVLAAGSWLVLRRGLRPLERMAATAGTITAGDLHTRVAPADGRGEVGQLGLALNTMLSQLEDAFAQQEATEQRLRQFLADASHELRTPLTSIQGFAELFRLGAEQNEADLAVTMRRIEEESGRMRHLVDDLLLLARLDQTRPLQREPVDLAVLAADACTDAVATDPSRRFTLAAPAPVMVSGDSDHLRQAIANLMTNALRHTPAGSPVDITARVASDGMAEVVVRDHGPGLDDDALAHVFDRFWQADASRADAGAGLGLAIVAAIAAEHDGTVSATNAPTATDPTTSGAVFTLRLPTSP
jgi:two-component system, OmpR family, sensor kinase